MKYPKTLAITAHGRDCNSFEFMSADRAELLQVEGYVPCGLGIGGGDDVELTIDVETGMIIGWDPDKFKRAYEALYDEHNPVEDDY